MLAAARDPLAVATDWKKAGLGARLEHLRIIRGWPGQNAVGAAIGMESGPISRLFNDKREVARREAGTLAKLAKLLEAEVAWLVDGSGPEPKHDGAKVYVKPEKKPQAREVPVRLVEREDRYPTRAAVLAGAREMGFNPAAIAAVARLGAKSDEDPGPQHWMGELRDWDKMLRTGLSATTEAFDDEALVVAPAAPRLLPAPKKKR